METVVVNLSYVGSLVSSVLCLLAGIWCIRKTVRFINRTK